MSVYVSAPADIKTLIGEQTYSGYLHREQEQELLEASACDDEPLVCYFCSKQITQVQPINLHHPQYKSNGGTQVEPAHEQCHIEYHSRQGDFREFGKRSSMTRAWAFNLKNVRTNPAFDFDRAYYLMLYAR
jgi:hypothetical protein